MSKTTTKPVRFAGLVRVSTERQEQVGESLNTQRKEVTAAVVRHGGEASAILWYGGQEHGTSGWERKELERLLNDARGGKIDSVVVASADRWSRDNAKSAEGLEVLRVAKVRFLVGPTEYDLFKPEHVLFLSMSSVFGEFSARQQCLKSLNCRIDRARRGWPSAGKSPFGRVFDERTATWHVKPEAQSMVTDVARRYLAGESMSKLAAEHGQTYSNLCKILTTRCGPVWVQKFESAKLNVSETVETVVPRLLPDEVIGAVIERAKHNKCAPRKGIKNDYLFGRLVFCQRCGYGLTGQSNRHGTRYYRHLDNRSVRSCDRPPGWVDADELERVVMTHLFTVFGNPIGVRRALEEATPDAGKVEATEDKRTRLAKEVEKCADARGRLVRAVAKGIIEDDEAAAEMVRLREKEAKLQGESARLLRTIENAPDPEKLAKFAARAAAVWNARMADRLESMSWQEKRDLVTLVFSGKTGDGRRMGIYLEQQSNPARRGRGWDRRWTYTLHGHLIQSDGILPASDDAAESFGDAHPLNRDDWMRVTQPPTH